MRDELVQGRVKETDRGRQTFEGFKDASKVGALGG